MSLETVVAIEYGGGLTILKLRDNKEEEKEYVLRDSVPLRVGYKVEVIKTSKIKLKIKKQDEEFQRIQEMNIYDNKTLIGRYKEKHIDCITI